MTDMTDWQAKTLIPTLNVLDISSALDFYTQLGFNIDWKYPNEKSVTEVGLCLGDISVMLSLSESNNIQKQNVYVIIENVESYHEYLKNSLVQVSELVSSDYGMKDFSVTDPWGNLFTFGEEFKG